MIVCELCYQVVDDGGARPQDHGWHVFILGWCCGECYRRQGKSGEEVRPGMYATRPDPRIYTGLTLQSPPVSIGGKPAQGSVIEVPEGVRSMILSNQSLAYYAGAKAALYCYAWWKNGEMFVGSCGKPYKKALAEIEQLERESHAILDDRLFNAVVDTLRSGVREVQVGAMMIIRTEDPPGWIVGNLNWHNPEDAVRAALGLTEK